MSGINYPTGSSQWKRAKNTDNHAGRGASLETDLNDSNAWYRETDRALIYKKPTPIQVVKVDYPARDRAKITEAYYRTPSTTDYNGVYRGRYIDFEAKETRSRTGFPLYLIHEHQKKHLEKVLLHGGIGFFIIRFSTRSETWLVDAGKLLEKIRQTQHSSIPYEWFASNGALIEESLYPRLAYLKIVDDFYFSKEENNSWQKIQRT